MRPPRAARPAVAARRWQLAVWPGVCEFCGLVYLTGAPVTPDEGGWRCAGCVYPIGRAARPRDTRGAAR